MSVRLIEFLNSYDKILVLTGAGVSTASGIPDYRDENGTWKHRPPMEYREFIGHVSARQRYWARSFVGWHRFRGAQPNSAHISLARLEAMGKLSAVITQNVDGLHQVAGSRNVIELHGSLEQVVCLDCANTRPRAGMQERLHQANPPLAELTGTIAPDGDAQVENFDVQSIRVPDCEDCGGVLKPTVVFFGETLRPGCADTCTAALAESEAMLVLGSSLMVFSGYRLVRDAVRAGKPVLLINRGKTRADDLVDTHLHDDCGQLLTAATNQLENPSGDQVAM